jgi:hypothetical protein
MTVGMSVAGIGTGVYIAHQENKDNMFFSSSQKAGGIIAGGCLGALGGFCAGLVYPATIVLGTVFYVAKKYYD